MAKQIHSLTTLLTSPEPPSTVVASTVCFSQRDLESLSQVLLHFPGFSLPSEECLEICKGLWDLLTGSDAQSVPAALSLGWLKSL